MSDYSDFILYDADLPYEGEEASVGYDPNIVYDAELKYDSASTASGYNSGDLYDAAMLYDGGSVVAPADSGWFSSYWFDKKYFPPVWFAPGDESGVPDEELRQEYRGNGRQRRGPFSDATDADIERLVREKWEAIERADIPRPDDQMADQEGESAAAVEDLPAEQLPAAELAAPLLPPAPIRPLAASAPPTLPPLPNTDHLAAILIEQDRQATARQQQNEAALILLLSEA